MTQPSLKIVHDADGLPEARSAAPDPDVQAFLDRLNRAQMGTLDQMTLPEGRRSWQLMVKAFSSREPVASVIERQIPGPGSPIRIRAYVPQKGRAPRPALVWFHGGGFVVGDLYTAGSTCRALANRTGAIVVAVRYRLAPEHDLYAGREDCLAAVRWVARNGAELGIDTTRIAVGGDSAGGNLAAAVAQACLASGPELCLQLLVYPAVDLVNRYPSEQENARGYFLTRESMDWMESLFATGLDLADPRLSPLFAKDIRGLAPALVVTAGFDPIRDHGFAYYDRLRKEGVAVELLHYPGQIHGFLSFDRVLKGARKGLDEVGAKVARAFEDAPENDAVPASGLLRWLTAPVRRSRRQMGQRVNEAVVGTIFARELLGRWKDDALGWIWGLWNLPTATEVERLHGEIGALARRLEGLDARLATSLRADEPDER